MQLVLPHVGFTNGNQVIKGLIVRRRTLFGNRYRKHILSGRKVLGHEPDPFRGCPLFGCGQLQRLAIQKFVVLGRQQRPAVSCFGIVGIDQRFIHPQRERRAFGGRTGLLKVELTQQIPPVCCQQHVDQIPGGNSAPQHAVGRFDGLLVGQLAAFALHRIGSAGRKTCEYRRAKECGQPFFKNISRFHNYSFVSLIFGISMPAGHVMSLSATPSLPYIE